MDLVLETPHPETTDTKIFEESSKVIRGFRLLVIKSEKFNIYFFNSGSLPFFQKGSSVPFNCYGFNRKISG